jgi:IS30 family transposase
MWVSHETIYQSIYVQGRGALRRELAVHLRTGRAVRKPRRGANQRRGQIPDMVNMPAAGFAITGALLRVTAQLRRDGDASKHFGGLA